MASYSKHVATAVMLRKSIALLASAVANGDHYRIMRLWIRNEPAIVPRVRGVQDEGFVEVLLRILCAQYQRTRRIA